ncbi:hypothetical protein E2320_004295, partial [Naja naja]
MAANNPGIELDLTWLARVRVNHPAVLKRAAQIETQRSMKKNWLVRTPLFLGFQKRPSPVNFSTVFCSWCLLFLSSKLNSGNEPVKDDLAVTCIDLTTLSGDDTPYSVCRLCHKAKHPIREELLQALKMGDKARVADAVKALKSAGCHIPVASVAAGFPAGQTPLKTRLEEIQQAMEEGAKEVDIVINRTLVLTGQWK